MKYLPLYYKWIKEGMPGNAGLCMALQLSGECKIQDVFLRALKLPSGVWESAALDYWIEEGINGDFDKVRQTMLLLIAAENNEL